MLTVMKIFGTLMFGGCGTAFVLYAIKEDAALWRKIALGGLAGVLSGAGIASIWIW